MITFKEYLTESNRQPPLYHTTHFSNMDTYLKMIRFSEFMVEGATPPAYTWREVEAVAKWMNFGSSRIDKKIYEIHSKLPQSAKVYSGPAYRFIFFPPKYWNMIMSGKQLPHRKLESWTNSEAMAKRLAAEIGPPDGADSTYTLAIIKVTPSANQIFINIVNLWKNKEWNDTIEYYMSKRMWFNEGLDFEDTQKEVILQNLGSFNKRNIVSIWDYNKRLWK